MISFVPARNYLFKISNLSKRITCESCLILRMSVLTIFNINDVSGVVLVSLFFIVNCEHISNFVLIFDFEQAKVCLLRIEKTNTFINKLRLNLYHHKPTGKSVKNFCEGVYFKR